MALRTKVDLLDNAAVKVKVTIPKKEVQQAYDDLVKDYCKKASIKGFRKGKVPTEVLVRKLGDALLGETAQKLVEGNLAEVFEKVEQKPLPYAMPELEDDLKLVLDKAFSFEVTFDTFPEVELGEYKGLEVTEPVVSVGKEDVDRELAAIREQNSVVIDKPDGTVARDDTVTIDYVELDEEGAEAENTRREGFTFQVGSGYNLYKVDDDIVGMKKGESKALKKEYAVDFEMPELAGRTVDLKVTVNAVKEKKLPEIDDELAQDVSEEYENLADLESSIRERLQVVAKQSVRQQSIDQLLTRIVADSKIPLPESMVRRELDRRWRSFVSRLQGNEDFVIRALQEQGKTRGDLYAEWRPDAETNLMRRLAESKVAELENIQVSEEEVDEEIKKESGSQDQPFEEVKKRFVEANLTSYIEDGIRTRKIHDLLLAEAKVKKGKKVKLLDILQGKD